MVISVRDGTVEEVELFRETIWLLRWDVWPFLLVYLAGLGCALVDNEESRSLKLAGLVAVPVGLVAHLILFLFAQSSVAFRAMIGKTRVSSFAEATWVLVTAAKNAGKNRLVPVVRGPSLPQEAKLRVLSSEFPLRSELFRYQEVTYYHDSEAGTFKRLTYPEDFSSAALHDWQGYVDDYSTSLALRRWGINEFHIPVPHFLDLYMEHLVAPFFVFQVLCLFLWSLDDYWYYSMFTLFMLLLFEGVMCKQRQNNVLMMRNMRRPAVQIFVFRNKKWQVISSDALVPGDLISLTSDPAIDVSGVQAREEGKVSPCDVLLLGGSCVVNEAMLTGESTPKVKESVMTNLEQVVGVGAPPDAWARHIVLGGTLIQQHTPMGGGDWSAVGSKLLSTPSAPDMGCLALVLRTGFATTQGELMRKILFATEGVTGATTETFSFIGVLVLFALVAATVVLVDGLQDMQRNKFRLVLHCIMIITSVVPPELPMELSLAITNSLAALVKSMVYCTEPFRIALAGKIDVVCFDKTGTLTKDEMMLRGVAAAKDVIIFPSSSSSSSSDDASEELDGDLLEPYAASDLAKCIMGSCHDLILQQPRTNQNEESTVLGDPLDMAAFGSSGFKFFSLPSGAARNASAFGLFHPELEIKAVIRQRFPFTSDLKRMTTVVTLSRPTADSSSSSSSGRGTANTGSEVTYIFSKGAPEALQEYLRFLPRDYASVYSSFMKAGKRVLTLAYKPVPASQLSHVSRMTRKEAESALLFAGFLVFDCDLKVDSRGVLKDLHYAGHRTVMITGDSVYTAANVARRLGMIHAQRPILALVAAREDSPAMAKGGKDAEGEEEASLMKLVWRSLDSAVDITFPILQESDLPFHFHSLKDDPTFTQSNVLCATGKALDELVAQHPRDYLQALRLLTPHLSIFARVSPHQKEKILLALNDSGHTTLMCGDGTNDVGALKAAHVGVSIVNNPRLESYVEQQAALASGEGGSGKKGKKLKSTSKDRMSRAVLEMKAHQEDPSLVKLGDASIASPFTSKRTSVDCVLTVIRQGRCTLVTTIQVYKVLALNCLASAFMMSILYLKGLKQGDTQMTCSGLVVATLFFFLSQAKPLLDVSDHRPPSSVFNPAVTVSILGQFLIHLTCMWGTMMLCESVVSEDASLMPSTPDGKFTPNLMNTAMFILSTQMQINNFWVNYRGPPFMQALNQNVYFWYLLQAAYLVILIVVGGQFEPMNDLLQLVSLPSRDFQIYFLLILVANAGLAYLVETTCRKLE